MVTTAGIRENGGGRRTPRRRTTLKVCGRIGFREPSMNYSIPCSPSLRMTLEKLGELTLGCCSRYRLWRPSQGKFHFVSEYCLKHVLPIISKQNQIPEPQCLFFIPRIARRAKRTHKHPNQLQQWRPVRGKML